MSPELEALVTLAYTKGVRKRYKGDSANEVTRAIIDYLKLSGCYATRISTEGRMAGGRRIRSSVDVGTADIHACVAGHHVSIEVKFGRDKQSVAQRTVEQQVQDAGGLYFIAPTFEAFHRWVNAQFPGTFQY